MAAHKLITGVDDPRVRRFVEQVGPKVLDYLKTDGTEDNPKYRQTVVISIPTGGILFGTELYNWLLRQGVDAEYAQYKKGGSRLYKSQVRDRVAIVVDDAVQTGKTYRDIISRLQSQRKNLGLVEIKYAVDHDPNHLADFRAENGENDKERSFIDRLLRR